MTNITYNLAPEHQRRYVYPASYGASAGLPVVGGKIYTYRADAHTTDKATYLSNVGAPPTANTNPIILDSSGECVIYWAFDSSDPGAADNFYYVELRDPNDVLIDSYSTYNGVPYPTGGSGSDGVTTTNYVRNPQMNFNRFKPYPAVYALTTIPTPSNYTGTYTADDWLFTKSKSGATETVTVTPFVAGTQEARAAASNYIAWACTAATTAETYKYHFQQYQNVTTFAGQIVNVQLLANSTVGTTVSIYIRQYFGSGGSADVETFVLSQLLTSTMGVYSANIQIPTIVGKTVGAGNLVQLEIWAPLNATFQIGFTNVAISLVVTTSDTRPDFPLQTLEQQRSQLDKDWFILPTGDVKFNASFTTSSPGWIPLKGGTIGNALSGATTLASEDACALYTVLWNNTIDANCAVSTGRGANALADFNANKTLSLPVTNGTFFRSEDNANALHDITLCSVGGAVSSTALVDHTHTFPGGQHVPGSVGVFGDELWTNGAGPALAPTNNSAIGDLTATASSGTGASFSIMNPYAYFYSSIKL